MTPRRNAARTHRPPSAPWNERAERAITAMIQEDLAAPASRDGAALAERSQALAARITAHLASALHPGWEGPAGGTPALRYDDELLPPKRRGEIAAQLQALLRPAQAELVAGGHPDRAAVWAVMITDIVLSEVGQELLDSPVAYAADIARAVDRVSTYLCETVATQRHAPGEGDLMRSSAVVLDLIIQEACPYYLAQALPEQQAQSKGKEYPHGEETSPSP